MFIHDLNGCAPVPLAYYLKALGILRLVAEQADPAARGWWEGERFRLMTQLSSKDLEGFFLERYEPTPMVAPWNGGTGFYPKDKKAQRAVSGIRDHPSPRFENYRTAIESARLLVGDRKQAPEKKEKESFLISCRLAWRGPLLHAMEAAVVIGADGKTQYPSLLGTGFNDGRLDFTSNYMERLLQLIGENGKPSHATGYLLANALWSLPAAGMDIQGAIGQFMPGNAGGANSRCAPDGGPSSNPWDFVLMLEGAVLFSAHATRRLGATENARAAAPFAVGAQGAGYVSASDSDEGARGEQWMPLWSQPVTLAELRRLLSEGRAQIGAKTAREPLDLARAIARLGTARGIYAFQRYGYIERNGQSNLAVPLGRFHVPRQTSPRLSCLDDLDAWLPRLRRQARDKHAPARLRLVERRLADALFAVTQHPDEPDRWQTVLLALADVEAVQVAGSGFQAGPVPKLRPEWVGAADDGSREFRLALACGLQAAGFTRHGKPIAPVRQHWLPLEQGRYATSGSGGQTRLQTGPQQVMQGRSGLADAIALVERRLVEAAQQGQRRLPLQAASRAAAAPSDLDALIAGEVDLDRTLALARALMALDSARWASWPCPPRAAPAGADPDDAWLAIRLALLPWPLPDGRRIGADPAIFRRLSSGDAAGAVELALRRLAAAGIRTTVRVATTPPERARLWAAALAFPITQSTAQNFLRRLDPNAHSGELA